MEKLEFTIKGNDGNVKRYETICTIEIEEYAHNYICYTDNSFDENGELKIFISAYSYKDDELNIFPIKNEKEWEFVKKVFNKKINSKEGDN